MPPKDIKPEAVSKPARGLIDQVDRVKIILGDCDHAVKLFLWELAEIIGDESPRSKQSFGKNGRWNRHLDGNISDTDIINITGNKEGYDFKDPSGFADVQKANDVLGNLLGSFGAKDYPKHPKIETALNAWKGKHNGQGPAALRRMVTETVKALEAAANKAGISPTTCEEFAVRRLQSSKAACETPTPVGRGL